MKDSSRRNAIRTTVRHLAARWAGADKDLLRQVFPLLAMGQPVRVEQIAEISGATPARIEEALACVHAERDAQGRVVEVSGLTLNPTLHRVEVNGVALFSCCALLAHLAPFLLAETVRLESVDPQTRSLVKLELTLLKISSQVPKTALGSFVSTEPGAVANDVGANFCAHVHHFTDRQSASMFVTKDQRRYIVELSELRDAAEALYRAVWNYGVRVKGQSKL